MLVNYFPDQAGARFDGVNVVPPVLVGTVQNLLAQQGIDPAAINADGSINPAALVTSAFDTITIRSNLSEDPIVINLHGPPDPVAAGILQELQPEVTLSGRAGQFTIAPNGKPNQVIDFSSSIASVGLGTIAAVLGVALLGYAILR